MDFLGDEKEAQVLYQAFKSQVIARLPMNEAWILTTESMAAHVETLRREFAASLPSRSDVSE